MKAATAISILEAAKEGGYYDQDFPNDEEELLKEAEFYLGHAKAVAETAEADDTIKKIVKLGDENGTKGFEDPDPETGKDREAPASETIEDEHLPIPGQIEGDPPKMPMDLSDISDRSIRRLSGEFNACLARTIWLLSEALTDELNLKQLRDAAYRTEFLRASQEARDAGTKALKDELDLIARSSAHYLEYETKVREAEKRTRDYKALKEIYGGNIDRLSREATLRDDEFRRSGGSKK